MNRTEYLQQLQSLIQALPLDEQTEALGFYRDYFDDANDDERVINELGTPEELARAILEKFACVPAKKTASAESDNGTNNGCSGGSGDCCGDGSNTNGSDATRARFTFNKDEVRNLDLSFGAAEVVIISGENYAVEVRGMNTSTLRCELSPYGTLAIDNTRTVTIPNFLNRRDTKYWYPRILLTVPTECALDMMKLHIGAGSVVGHGLHITCEKGFVDVGAGNIQVDTITGGRIDVRCGMGNIEMNGAINGFSRIDCGMGNIALKLKGEIDSYSYDVKVALGEVKINGDKRSGICESHCQTRKDNHFSINCGLGAVNISMNN